MLYCNIQALLDRFIQFNEHVKYLEYTDFHEFEKIGSGAYGTVYTAKYKNCSAEEQIPETVALKRFKSFDGVPKLSISEVSKRLYH